jgi:hypothetical protein
MPLGQNKGFVFTESGTDIFRTIAHELGHGAFTLRHPFSDYTSLTKGDTDNLMDYTSDPDKKL